MWAPDYVTAVELKSYVVIGDSVDDIEIGFAITAASRAIDHAANRQFGKVATTEERRYTARYDYERRCWVLDVDDVQTNVGLAVTVDGTTVTTFGLEPINAALVGRPWHRIVFTTDSEATPTGAAHEVAVTATWGWTTVPATIKQATLLQASRFLSRRYSPYGVAGSPDAGSELRLLSRVDPDVGVAVAPYRRMRGVF